LAGKTEIAEIGQTLGYKVVYKKWFSETDQRLLIKIVLQKCVSGVVANPWCES